MADRGERGVVPRGYWGPFSIMDEMERMFDNLRLGMEDFWFPRMGTVGPRMPVVDMIDAGNEYLVEAELPGIDKDNVQIEVSEDGIEIRAEKEESKEEKREGYLRRERGYQSFYRKLPLPEDASQEDIQASLSDGVLRVTIPKTKKAETAKKRVEVK